MTEAGEICRTNAARLKRSAKGQGWLFPGVISFAYRELQMKLPFLTEDGYTF
jgi:hypothetical protein